MGSLEEDIKPKISPDDPKTLLFATSSVTKLKQSRYEDVWPEDVHAAFMEAIALYPPMGKRRLKYYRVSVDQKEYCADINRTRSFGRCQLIQSYILEKTGKDRSRKQVSSHLQRLKKIHKDNPAMYPFFSECSYPPSHHRSGNQAIAMPSEDIFANISFGAHHHNSDFDLNVDLQNVDAEINSSPTFPCTPEATSFTSDSYHTIDSPSNQVHSQPSHFFSRILPPSQQHPVTDSYDYFPDLQDQSFKNSVSGGSRASLAFDSSAFSISMCHLASRRRQPDLCQTAQHPRMIQQPPRLGFQSAHYRSSHSNSTDGSYHGFLLSPPRDVFHTSHYPPHAAEPNGQLTAPDFPSDLVWPQHPETSFESRDGMFGEVCLRNPTYQYSPTCPETRGYFTRSYSGCSTTDGGEMELPRRLGCPVPYRFPNTTVVSTNVSRGSSINFPGIAMLESPKEMVSLPVIRPTPIYPISYTHSDR